MKNKRTIIIFIFIMLFSISISLSWIYYSDKYSVNFETGTDEIILTKYVEKNGIVNEPTTPTKEGYVFKEWQLNGKKYDFNTEIHENITLTAEWIKEEYITIVFDTDCEYKIKNKKILKGNSIDELPIPEKENSDFIGWYLNGKLYNNEEIYSDITLKAEYKNHTVQHTYKIGDTIKIVGNYASSAHSLNAYNKKAIGWNRKIINIIENAEYPYVIGNSSGVTGFFKVDSIEKIY